MIALRAGALALALALSGCASPPSAPAEAEARAACEEHGEDSHVCRLARHALEAWREDPSLAW